MNVYRILAVILLCIIPNFPTTAQSMSWSDLDLKFPGSSHLIPASPNLLVGYNSSDAIFSISKGLEGAICKLDQNTLHSMFVDEIEGVPSKQNTLASLTTSAVLFHDFLTAKVAIPSGKIGCHISGFYFPDSETFIVFNYNSGDDISDGVVSVSSPGSYQQFPTTFIESFVNYEELDFGWLVEYFNHEKKSSNFKLLAIGQRGAYFENNTNGQKFLVYPDLRIQKRKKKFKVSRVKDSSSWFDFIEKNKDTFAVISNNSISELLTEKGFESYLKHSTLGNKETWIENYNQHPFITIMAWSTS